MAAGRIVVPSYSPARERNGRLVAGALLTVCENGTTTKASIYSDEALTTPLANPVEANSSGRFPAVWAEGGTEEAPVLYSVSVTGPDGESIGNPNTFDNWRPSVDAETAQLALIEAAADQAAADAASAEGALAEIEDIVANAPDAPSVVNKLNRDGSNIGDDAQALRDSIGLGDSATRDVGTTTGTVAAGDDGRFEVGNLTRAEAALFTVPPSVSAIRTTGYSAAGDGGGGLYVRVETEPAHAGKVQSADGAWWELSEVAVTLPMFGGARFTGPIDASENGFRGTNRTQFTDALPAFTAFKGYQGARRAAGKLTYLLIDGYYYFGGTTALDQPGLTINGIGRDNCGVRVAMFSSLTPGFHARSQSISVADFEICADDRGGSDPGDTGQNGTCITWGDYFSDAEPGLVSGAARNMRYTRAVGARVKHATCVIGRVLGFTEENPIYDGRTRGHNSGILIHWGALADGIGEPITETYHPDQIVIRNHQAYDLSRVGTISSPCNVDIGVGQAEGCAEGWRVVSGDESAHYASAEFAGRVFSRISITKQSLKGLTGLGLSVSGTGASKVDAVDEEALWRQDRWGVACFDDWSVECDDGEAEFHAEIMRLSIDSLSMKGWSSKGVTTSGVAFNAFSCNGSFEIGGTFDGAAGELTDCSGFNFSGATFKQPVIVANNFGFRATGTQESTTLDASITAGATTITLDAALSVPIFLGQPIVVDGHMVRATGCFRAGLTEIEVTPVPAAVTAGAVVTLDNTITGLRGALDVVGGDWGINLEHVKGFDLTTTTEATGRYGHYCPNSSGVFRGSVFRNTGVRRAETGSLSTRDVLFGAGSDIIYIKPYFGLDGKYVQYNVGSVAGANGGKIIDGVFDQAISGHEALATPTNEPIRFENCRTAAGARVAIPSGSTKVWTPVINIGGSPTGITSTSVSGSTRYDEQGGFVTYLFDITLSSKGAGSGPVTISGQPIVPVSGAGNLTLTSATGLSGAVGMIANGGVFELQQWGASGVSALTDAELTNTTRLQGSIVCRAS